MNGPEHQRLVEGLRNAEFSEILGIVSAAIALKEDLYAKRDTSSTLFRVRKALEGIWGHDLPRVDQWGEDLPQ